MRRFSPRATKFSAVSSTTRRQFLATLGAAGLVSTAGCVSYDRPTYEGTWSRRGYDDAQTGSSPATGPTGDLYVSWRADVFEGYPPTSPVVADETVYHLHTRGGRDTQHDTVVSAFDAATGEERWQTTVSTTDFDKHAYHHDSLVVTRTRSVPASRRAGLDDAVSDDCIYARTFEGIHALSTDGELLWTHPVPTTGEPHPLAAPPIVSGGLVVTATYGERTPPAAVVAVDAETGDIVWRAGFDDRRIPWTLSAADGTVYVPFFDGDSGLVVLDLETGVEDWAVSLPVDGPVTVSGDTLLVPLREDETESIAAVDRNTREIRWQKSVGRRTDSGVAVADDLVYYCTNAMLTARRLDTGELAWSFGPEPHVSFSWTPVVAGTTVYALAEPPSEDSSDDGSPPYYLYALDTANGEVRGRAPALEHGMASSLAVVDGAVYLAGRDELRCYESCAFSVRGRCLVE